MKIYNHHYRTVSFSGPGAKVDPHGTASGPCVIASPWWARHILRALFDKVLSSWINDSGKMHFSHSSLCFGPRVIRGINSSLNNITEDSRGDWKGGGGCHVTGWVHSNWQKGNNMDLVGNSPCWHGTILTWVGHICTLGLLSWHWLVDPNEDDWWRRHPANIHKQLGSGDNMRSDKVHFGKRIWRAVTPLWEYRRGYSATASAEKKRQGTRHGCCA